MKIGIDEKKLTALLTIFYAEYFDKYLNEMIEGDEEQSVVTLFKGMEFFLETVKELDIDFGYKTVEEYIVKEYENGEEVFRKLKKEYDMEYEYYEDKEREFEDIFGCAIKEF